MAKLGVQRTAGRRLIALMIASVVVLAAAAAASAYDPTTDVNSMSSTTSYIGAQAWWNAGYTGKGIDVAVIDTGVAPVAGLDAPDKVVYGPDLSLESQAPNLTNLDANGHGTFMAGLVAANSPDYRGVAPDARIVSVKVGTADGGADVTQVIAAIDWVVQHAHDPGFNIRVISLSYGTNSLQPAGTDPLAYAAEQAWKHGIVVIAATGNTGYQKGAGATGIADPGYDPWVIGVGATTSSNTPATSDDLVAPFSASSQCRTCKIPDILAPGAHIQGLAVPGSYIWLNHPEGAIDGRFFRGSGTSEATAIAAGAAALVLQRYPSLTPDAVKRYFLQSGIRLSGTESAQGGGELNLKAMLSTAPPATYVQKLANGTGTGTIEAARGQDHLTRDGVVLTAERDIFGAPVSTRSLASAEAAGSSWSGGTWNGSSWSGSSWSGSSWSGSSWSGSSWSGSSWSGSSWSGSSWSGSSWSGSSWSGDSWASDSWG